jgi:hypothetical protein
MMKTRFGILFSLVMLALAGGVGIAAADEAGSQAVPAEIIAPYNGTIGPDNSLYGLKIAFENLDESFTFNQSDKLAKQINHTEIRLAELKKELAENKSDAADRALDEYWQKMNQTEAGLGPLAPYNNESQPAVTDTGLQRAGETIAKHQQVLEDLLQSHPDNKGLARAYNNSITLEQRFTERIETRLQNHLRAGNTSDFPPGMNQSINRNGNSQNGFTGNTTDIPPGMNQSMNRNGNSQNGFTGNTTDFRPGMNQTMDRNGNGPDTANQTAQGQHQQTGNAVPGNSQTQNNNVNNGNGQNTQNNANPGQNTNTGNKNNNADTNTGTRNGGNNGNTGAATSGNTNENQKSAGR